MPTLLQSDFTYWWKMRREPEARTAFKANLKLVKEVIAACTYPDAARKRFIEVYFRPQARHFNLAREAFLRHIVMNSCDPRFIATLYALDSVLNYTDSLWLANHFFSCTPQEIWDSACYPARWRLMDFLDFPGFDQQYWPGDEDKLLAIDFQNQVWPLLEALVKEQE